MPSSESAEHFQPPPVIPPSESASTTAESQKSAIRKYDMHFGINGGMYPDISEGISTINAVTRDLDKLGMVWLRHPGKGTTWFEVQPTEDTWNFEKLDAVINNNDHPWVIEIYGAMLT